MGIPCPIVTFLSLKFFQSKKKKKFKKKVMGNFKWKDHERTIQIGGIPVTPKRVSTSVTTQGV